MKKYRVAVVGATGMVGQEFIKMLQQRNFPMSSIQLLASDRSVGKRMFVGHKEIIVRETTADAFRYVDLTLFSAGPEVSRYFAPIAVKAGSIVIDHSAAFRMDAAVPLVVPEINPEDIKNHRGIIANPDSPTTQLVMVLYPLHKVNPVKRVIVTTFQSVSSTGTAGMEELTLQTKLVLEGHAVVPHVYSHQIAFNVLPEIDVFMDDGYNKEEWRIAEETRKILRSDQIGISATCVRVPVFMSHSEAVNVEFTYPMGPDEARRVLAQAPGVKVLDDPSVSLYPQPWTAAGLDDVFVGRIRKDPSHPNGLAMWIVADNLRKGAALNAIQIAEEAIRLGVL
ncbi:MAG: aspartate-semialdehyde dehydrogenase [Dehalococcoidia bacterium]|nr:aspartate-semialdehyde dehydrogenase [Dehalococcoidia bacterium]